LIAIDFVCCNGGMVFFFGSNGGGVREADQDWPKKTPLRIPDTRILYENCEIREQLFGGNLLTTGKAIGRKLTK